MLIRKMRTIAKVNETKILTHLFAGIIGLILGIIISGIALHAYEYTAINEKRAYERLYNMSYSMDDTDNFYLNIKYFEYVIGKCELADVIE